MAIEPSLLDDFRQIAEIAATLAGFAAVVGAIDRRGSSGLSTVRVSAFTSLLTASLPAIILALLPGWLRNVFESEEVVWRICFALFVLVQLVSFGAYFRTGIAKELSSSRASWQLVLLPFGLAFTIVGVACTAGFFRDYYGVLYQGSLIFLLLVACVAFGYLVSTSGHNADA